MRYSDSSESLMWVGKARNSAAHASAVVRGQSRSDHQTSAGARATNRAFASVLLLSNRFKPGTPSELRSRPSTGSITKGKATAIRILVAEDNFIARSGVTAVVNAQKDMRVIAEALNGQQAVSLYRHHRPDVVLMDLFMPVMDGFDATATIRAEFPAARIIALSTYGGEEDIYRAFQAGVEAYLTKDVLHAELIQAIQAVHSGHKHLSPATAAILSSNLERTHLTSRELEVLQCIVEGKNNKLIAHVLGIAEFTVKNHVKNILLKLGVEDRTQAVAVSIQRGIIHLK
jgi:two-component system, NarL family, response regulator